MAIINSTILWTLYIGVWLSMVSLTNSAAYSIEQDLMEQVISNYIPTRPVQRNNETVHVKIQLEIVQITVSTKAQTLSVTGFFRLKWKNDLIHWNASHYDGINTVNIDPHLMWFPEVVLHNSLSEERTWLTKSFKTKISVSSDGTCYWLSPIDFLSSCSFSIKDFPFDTQHCKITFGPWTDDISKVYMEAIDYAVVTSQYTENAEWDLREASHEIVTSYYKCCPIPFRDLVIRLTLTRKPLFYMVNSIVPCICLIVLLILGHRLPPQCGERITLTIMICLTCIVMMEYTNSKILPQTSEVSSFSKIFLTITIVASFSILETCYVLSLHHRSEGMLRWMPSWLTRLILKSSSSNESPESHDTHASNSSETPQVIDQGRIAPQMSSNEDEEGTSKETLNLIYEEIKNYNKEVNEDDFSHIPEQDAKKIAKFLDNVFIVAALISVMVALLVEIKL
ncbi:neuronal acetylcholine receptor subunit alpha-7-like [Clytia hemisphaerica]|uniref:Uncharacterized protein n=1 Tax=Clytia hemisphaerica TaxID=252671 RepID=A0A7M5VH05_9CNID|eukprot:TCONS_00004363-protein